MKKTIALILALMVLLSIGSLSVFAADYQPGTYVITVNDPNPDECYLNVRAGLPGDENYSVILGEVWNDTRVEVLEVVNTDWGKISFEGQTGYIRLKNYTTFVPADEPTDAPNDDGTPGDVAKPGDAGMVTFVVLASVSLAAIVVVKKVRV